MPRRARGSTTDAGYGYDHQQDRRALLARHVDGTPCACCGRPMYRSQALHADHDPPIALGGTKATRLIHARCNTSRGARLGNRLRKGRRPLPDPQPVRRALPEW